MQKGQKLDQSRVEWDKESGETGTGDGREITGSLRGKLGLRASEGYKGPRRLRTSCLGEALKLGEELQEGGDRN